MFFHEHIPLFFNLQAYNTIYWHLWQYLTQYFLREFGNYISK
ncbi:hypothetical protein HMPREF1141_0456 [Clostridium sp. MSTE9]|nr:hypothetical protein HMPREF1141_0456 [Clostridium sp. MSTE9]